MKKENITDPYTFAVEVAVLCVIKYGPYTTPESLQHVT